MTVVSNTSPLNYLVLIELQQLLPALFNRVIVPEAVLRELRSPAAPAQIGAWLDTAPDWLDSRVAADIPTELRHLGPGEREAIVLAESVDDGLVLLDERRARGIARQRGLAVTGTLGVLDLAAARGLVDLTDAFGRLARTNFRGSPRLLRSLRIIAL
jgi:predicted nucleic acid-binding protein